MTLTSTLGEFLSGRDIESREFRNILGHFASGITIISGHDGQEPIGFTCQSFYSVSMEPPLISFSVMTTSTTYPRIRETGRFAVNVLSEAQSDVSNQFARKGTDKWAGISWQKNRSANPVLSNTLAWLDCEIDAEYEAGDHFIVVGRVLEMCTEDWPKDGPLVFYKGQYRALHSI